MNPLRRNLELLFYACVRQRQHFGTNYTLYYTINIHNHLLQNIF